MEFQASRDRFVTGLTVSILFLFGLIAVIMVWNLVKSPTLTRFGLMTGVVTLLVAITVCAYAYTPSHYRLASRSLVIARPAGDIEIPYETVHRVGSNEAWLGLARKSWPGGNSGLFGVWGTFTRRDLGRYTVHGTRLRGAVVLDTIDGPVVLTPADRDAFVRELERRLQ